MDTINKTTDEQNAITLTEQANAIVIRSNDDRVNAETIMESLSDAEKRIFAYLDPPRAKAYDDYQYHKNRLDEAINPIKQARKETKQKCIKYDSEQERIRKAEQERLESEARKRAEDEALELAAQAEKEGDTETAQAIISDPVQSVPVFVPRTAPAPSKLTAGRKVYSAEVTDLKALCKAIGDGRVQSEIIIGIDYNKEKKLTSPALNKIASALKESMNIPGCKCVYKTV